VRRNEQETAETIEIGSNCSKFRLPALADFVILLWECFSQKLPLSKLEFLSGFASVGNDSQFQTIGVQHCVTRVHKRPALARCSRPENEHFQTGCSQTQYRLIQNTVSTAEQPRDTRQTFRSTVMSTTQESWPR